MTGAITRLAPTPSGFLHEGNALNFLLVARLGQEQDALVALRIDDIDVPRCRPEYVDDIFAVLDWLQIAWERGPRDRSDLESTHSLSLRTEYYREQLRDARAAGLEIFACRCTRAEISAAGGRGCIGSCRAVGYALVAGESVLRASTPMGDVVLWRRDDLPAYHLASIIEDRDLGTTLVVRGEDLLETTAVQRHLAPYFGALGFVNATFVHHPLVVGADGSKLSKSRSTAGPMVRSDELRSRLESMAQ